MPAKLFLDTNVLIDFLDHNRPLYESGKKIIELCARGDYVGCISETVITNCCYILRKVLTQDQLSAFFLDCTSFLTVLPCTNADLKTACKANHSDLEDAILYAIALRHRCSIFITSNMQDYVRMKTHELPVFTPNEFLERR
jgi:predicted nucleic acid-binding protein